MEPITLEELAAAIDGVHVTPAARDVVIDRLAIDASRVSPRDLFWAVSEEPREVHKHIALAESRGAVAVVASRFGAAPGPGRILVSDTRVALSRFARWYRSLLDMYVVGVAGSYGKATTRDLANAALGIESDPMPEGCDGDETVRLCLALLNKTAADRFAIVDLKNNRGELTNILRPEAAIITRFDADGERTTDELLETLPRGGFAVLPGDQAPAKAVSPRLRAAMLRVGHELGNTHRVRTDEVTTGRLRFRVDRAPFEIAAPGRQFSIPAGMAVIAARGLGRRDPEIAKNLEAFQPATGRGRVTMSRPWTIINETASGHPASLAAALAGLSEWPSPGRRIFVCGDLDGNQANLSGQALVGIDRLVAIGNFARQVAHDALIAGMDAHCLVEFSRREQASQWLRNVLRPDDVVWIKSARSAGLDQLIQDLVRHAETTFAVPMAA